MRSQLGFAPVVVAAAGGTGPLAPVVIGIAAAAVILPKLLHIGAGRTEADYLTMPPHGAQYVAGQALSDIIDNHYLPIRDAGQLTPAFVDSTIAALEKVRDDFTNYAGQFQRAGPGAIATIRAVVERLIGDRLREKSQIPETSTAPAFELPDVPGATTPAPGWWQVESSDVKTLLIVGGVLLALRRLLL